MDYTLREERVYSGSYDKACQSVEQAVKGLQGKVLKQADAAGNMTLWFDKTIHGQVLGDRTQMDVRVAVTGTEQVQIVVQSYPIDPVGRKLLFGARKDVNRTVLTWFLAHLDRQMGIN
jgi:hypothetical protein